MSRKKVIMPKCDIFGNLPKIKRGVIGLCSRVGIRIVPLLEVSGCQEPGPPLLFVRDGYHLNTEETMSIVEDIIKEHHPLVFVKVSLRYIKLRKFLEAIFEINEVKVAMFSERLQSYCLYKSAGDGLQKVVKRFSY